MRLIDADALKAEWYRLNNIDEEDCGARFVGYQEIPRLIDNAPTAGIKTLPSAEAEWIPCSERLPSVDGDVYLVTDYCPQINRRGIHIAYCYANKLGFWSDTPKGYEVLAWMPLPKPYREDGEV